MGFGVFIVHSSMDLPEGAAFLGDEQLFGGSLELCRRHVHRLLHLGGGGGDKVLVDVHA